MLLSLRVVYNDQQDNSSSSNHFLPFQASGCISHIRNAFLSFAQSSRLLRGVPFFPSSALAYAHSIHRRPSSSPRPSQLLSTLIVRRDSSVGIATRYEMDGPGIASRMRARFSHPMETGPGAHPASYTMGTGSFLAVKR